MARSPARSEHSFSTSIDSEIVRRARRFAQASASGDDTIVDRQPLNGDAARFDSSPAMPEHVRDGLNTAYDALCAIRAISSILVANQTEGSGDEDGAPLAPHLAAGLLTGVRVIAGLAGDELCRVADWGDEA